MKKIEKIEEKIEVMLKENEEKYKMPVAAFVTFNT